MSYLHFIRTKLDLKGGQIECLDATFQMHITAKIFDIIKYLKNEKNRTQLRYQDGHCRCGGSQLYHHFCSTQFTLRFEK